MLIPRDYKFEKGNLKFENDVLENGEFDYPIMPCHILKQNLFF